MVGESNTNSGGSVKITRAFGEDNRVRLINQYLDEHGPITPATAWKHVYALLLWIDKTTGLAHCYESDKSQPGRHWYGRSLEFHGWLADKFGCSPGDLADHLDWLFLHTVEDTANIAKRIAESRALAAKRQREPYEGQGFPIAGSDPELEEILFEGLEKWLTDVPPDEDLRNLTQKVRLYVGQENKRKNLLGEGFEDVAKAIIDRLNLDGVRTMTRTQIHHIGGFHKHRSGEKPKVVDLAVVTPTQRKLVSAKWSVRSDREEQFLTDFDAYTRLESSSQPFGHYWLTNEFDPARLVASSEKLVQNAYLFTAVVHISPEAVLHTYGENRSDSQERVAELIAQKRIVSFDEWLASL